MFLRLKPIFLLVLNSIQEELRPYFSLPKVMDGLFSLAKMLFDVIVEPADGLAPVRHIWFLSLVQTICFLKFI